MDMYAHYQVRYQMTCHTVDMMKYQVTTCRPVGVSAQLRTRCDIIKKVNGKLPYSCDITVMGKYSLLRDFILL